MHFLTIHYLLQWQVTNSCLLADVIIEADRRESELEGTYCASMKLLSAVVNSLRAHSRSSRPSFVPSRWSPEELISTTTSRVFLGARLLRSKSSTLTATFVPVSTAGSLEWERGFLWACSFLTIFCTITLNVDSILSYTEVASDFLSVSLTFVSVTSTNSMKNLLHTEHVWAPDVSKFVVDNFFNNYETIFASWHIFTCHNALRLFRNNHNTKFRVVSVSQMPQRVEVVFCVQWAFSIFELNIYMYCLVTSYCTWFNIF